MASRARIRATQSRGAGRSPTRTRGVSHATPVQLLGKRRQVPRREDVRRPYVQVAAERLTTGVEVKSVHDLRKVISEDAHPDVEPVKGEPLPTGHTTGGDGIPGGERRISI